MNRVHCDSKACALNRHMPGDLHTPIPGRPEPTPRSLGRFQGALRRYCLDQKVLPLWSGLTMALLDEGQIAAARALTRA